MKRESKDVHQVLSSPVWEAKLDRVAKKNRWRKDNSMVNINAAIQTSNVTHACWRLT